MQKPFARVALIRPQLLDKEPRLDLALNFLGIRMLLEQEGIRCIEKTAGPDLPDITTAIVVDSGCMTEEEQRAIILLSSRVPILYIGIPPEGPIKTFLGLEQSRVIEKPHLHVLRLSAHSITRSLKLPEERNLKIKYVPHLIDETNRPPRPLREVGGICLHDGRRIGPGVLVSDTKPRKVIIPFALGKAAACQIFKHGDLRNDLDLFDYPLHTTVDSLRTLLRNAILWCNPRSILLRPYYWPVTEGRIPHGCFCLNHDLCGYRKEALPNIKAACRPYGVTTTFFDYPPFRLGPGDPGDHDVAIHVPDSTELEKIIEAKNKLGEIHGREIRGWRRHGPTYPENWPAIWRRMEQAGIQWSTTFGVQTNSWMIRSEATAQANRLPARVIDVERGQRLNILEIPSFDSEDAERLADIAYGSKLDWKTFHRFVTRRFDFAHRHNLLTGYLIHGWTAGVAQEKEGLYGALDCQRMMREAIGMAKKRRFLTPGHEWLYDWWTWREKIVVDGGTVELPSGRFVPAMELLSASILPGVVSVRGKTARLLHWPARHSKMLVIDPEKTGTVFRIANLLG